MSPYPLCAHVAPTLRQIKTELAMYLCSRRVATNGRHTYTLSHIESQRAPVHAYSSRPLGLLVVSAQLELMTGYVKVGQLPIREL